MSSVQNQPRPQVAYLGPIASFSHQAALEYFKDTADLHPHPSFASIFNALQTLTPASTSHTTITHAIVPIENSSNGTVVSLLDLLADPENKYPDIKVCAEHYLAVHHCLLAAPAPTPPTPSSSPHQTTPINTIKTLYTHPQVWTQCTTYLTTHFPHAERIDTSSTSAAAQHLLFSSTPASSAAIGSALAAETLGLDILARNIEDDGKNTTRFLILYNDASTSTSHPLTTPMSTPTNHISPSSLQPHSARRPKQKSLLTFTLSHSLPGSLSLILGTFSTYDFNLTSIDTRPSRRLPWHYIFCVECEEVEVEVEASLAWNDSHSGRVKENFEKMLETLRSRTETVRYLGSWEDALES